MYQNDVLISVKKVEHLMAMNYDRRKHTSQKKKLFYKKCKKIWISWIYVKRNSNFFLKQVKNLFEFPEKVSIRLEVLKHAQQ